MFALLNKDAVLVTDDVLDKESAITLLVRQICSVYDIVDSEEILNKVIDRESKLSTGIGLEVAVPHCRSAQVPHVVMGVLLTTTGIDYNSIDTRPVKLIFLIVSPERDIKGHLTALSAISHSASDETIRSGLLTSDTSDRLYERLAAIK